MAPAAATAGRRQASARRGGGRSADRGRAGARGRGCRWRRQAAPSPASCTALPRSTLSEGSAALVPGVRIGVRNAPTDCHRPPRMLCVTITELPDCCRRTVPSPQFPQTVIPTLPITPPGMCACSMDARYGLSCQGLNRVPLSPGLCSPGK